MTETFQILIQSMAKKHQIMKMALMKSFIQAGWEMDMDFQLVMVLIKIFKQIIKNLKTNLRQKFVLNLSY